MKIEYGAFVIFDLAVEGSVLVASPGSLEKVLQVSQPIDGAEVRIFDRGNVQSDLSFEVSRRFASQIAASTHLLITALAIANITSEAVRLTAQNDGGGEQVYTVPAKFKRCQWRRVGRRTFHTYSFIGGRPVQGLGI